MKTSLSAVGLAVCLLLSVLIFPAQAAERLDKILAQKVLRVGTPGDYRPFCMRTGNGHEGHDVDLVRLIGVEMGVRVVIVPTSWPSLMDDFKSGKFDIAAGGITRTMTRMKDAEFLPPYAPFGKVALIRKGDADILNTLERLNQPSVRVLKNPGGTNEIFVDTFLTNANVSIHNNNAEIPGLIAAGEGDVMITETYEASLYSRMDNRLYAMFLDKPLTPLNYMGVMIPKNDPDLVRVLNFTWQLLQDRGELNRLANTWLK